MNYVANQAVANADSCKDKEHETIGKNREKLKGLKSLIAIVLIVLCFGTMPVFGQNYDAAGTVAYAVKWATNTTRQDPPKGQSGHVGYDGTDRFYHNPDYTYYNDDVPRGVYGDEVQRVGSDCSNFVSQCLAQGGRLSQFMLEDTKNGFNDHVNSCITIHKYLKNLEVITETRDIGAGVPDWLKPGDVVMWWSGGEAGKGSHNHAAIVVTSDKELNAHTSNRWHRATSFFGNGDGYWNKVSFYQIPSQVPADRPIITDIIMQGTTVNNKTILCGDYLSLKVSCGSVSESNIKVIVSCLTGEPNYEPNDGESWSGYKGEISKEANPYTWYWGPQNKAVWEGHWVKFIACNTRGTSTTTDDIWGPARYVKVIPPNADLKPKLSLWQKIVGVFKDITGLRSTQETVVNFGGTMYDVQEVEFGDRINIFANGNGYAGDGSWEDYDQYVGVLYGILVDNPKFTNDNEAMYNGHKYGAWHADDVSQNNCYSFTPETRSEWEGRYAKIIIHNDMFGTWSEPRYIKIIPTLATLTVSSGTLSPTFNPDITNYTVNIPNSVSSINISATANSGATTIYGRGNQNVSVGTNTFNVSIVGVNGSGKTYTVIVNRAPANDLCSSATNLSCGTSVQGTMAGATPTTSVSYPQGSTQNDVFYQFKADNAGTYTITLTKSNSSDDIDLGLYSSCNATNVLAQLTNNNITETMTYNCVAGTTYLIRATDWKTGSSSGNFTIKVDCPTTVIPTGVTLNKTSTTLSIGGTEQLTATITPSNATNKTVTWSSNNTNIATVSSTGLITAKAAGNATITVTTQDGNKTATCTVTVTPALANDLCANATPLSCGTLVSGTTTGATPTTSITYGSVAGAYTADKNDVFYQFTATTVGTYTVTLNNPTPWNGSGNDINLALYSSCNSTNSLAELTTDATTATMQYNHTGGTTTYIIRAFSYNNASGNFTIKVDCPPSVYTISTSSNPTAGGTTSGGGSYNSGASCTVKATVNTGYTFTNWTENGTEVSSNANYPFTVSANRNLVANFKIADVPCTTPPQYDVDLGTPTISGNWLTDQFQGNCDIKVFRISVTSGNKYRFSVSTVIDRVVDLYNASGVAIVHSDSGTSTNQDETIEWQATYTGYVYAKVSGNNNSRFNFFYSQMPTIIATASTGGTISPSGTVFVSNGSNHTFTATPNSGKEVDQWILNGSVVQTRGTTYTVSNVNANATLQVTFKNATTWQIGDPNPFSVIATYNNGTLTITGTGAMQNFDPATRLWVDVKDNITSVVINNGVTTIGDGAFQELSNLTSVTIPNSIIKIGTHAFLTCPKLISLPNGMGNSVQEIQYGAFDKCSSLTSINIPKSVNIIAQWAFAFMYALNNVTINWTTPFTFTDGSVFSDIDLSKVTLNVPSGTACTYAAADNWKDFNIVGASFTVSPSAGTGGSISPNSVQTIKCGNNVTFTAMPNSGKQVDQWLLNGSAAQIGGTTYTVSNVKANATVQVTFKDVPPTYFTIKASAGTGGIISPSGDVNVNSGANQTFTFTPNTNYAIDVVTVDGAANSTAKVNGNYTFTNVTAGHSISVTFKENSQYTISISANPTAGGTTSGNGFYFSGASCSVCANANNGYTFTNWTENGSVVSTSTCYTFTVSANRNLVANFSSVCTTPPNYDYALPTPTTSWQTRLGSIQSGGCYVYRISVTSGQKYTFKTGCGNGAVSDFESEIFLYDNSGAFLTWTPSGICESGGTKIEDYQFNYSGYAYVRVKGYGAIGESTTYGNYTLAYQRQLGTGIDDVQASKISIYPNPAQNELFIRTDLTIKKVEINDLTGHNVKILNATSSQNGVQTISVSSLLKGIYLVKVYTENGVVVSKIVKE